MEGSESYCDRSFQARKRPMDEAIWFGTGDAPVAVWPSKTLSLLPFSHAACVELRCFCGNLMVMLDVCVAEGDRKVRDLYGHCVHCMRSFFSLRDTYQFFLLYK